MKLIEKNPEFGVFVELNDGYCPCKEFREQKEPGECHCGRFEKVV